MDKNKILVVDDDANTCELLSILLGKKGYETAVANSGEDAILWLRDHNPDLVVLDVMMPEMDGWETYYHVRELYDVPVIFLTALSSGDNAARALNLGVKDYIRKPFNNDELLARIGALVNSRTRPITQVGRWNHLLDQRPSVSVVIPTLNEAENLPLVMPYFPMNWVDEIILVDGRSVDGTVEIAKKLLPTIKIVLEKNPGKGAALQAGYEAAGGEIVIVLDADGSHDPREIPRYIVALMEGADFVKGSRFAPGGGTTDMPRYRQLGNAFFVFLANTLFGATFTDLCYGYHAFWKYSLNSIELRYAKGFEIDTVLYLGALREKLRITEVPSFEGFRFYGNGKLRTIPDGFRVLVSILRAWWTKLSPSDSKEYIGFRGNLPNHLSRPAQSSLHVNSKSYEKEASSVSTFGSE
jgi:CheY-like chemotaxis protein/glycosyltransferase involved in cell wall biosynthesis